MSALRTGRPTTLLLPPDLVVTGAVVDFTPQEVQVLPVRYGVITVGVLVVAFTRPSRPETTAVIQATLPGLAVAVNNALNHEDLQRVAALDPLTGVYNRRFGLQRLVEEFGRSLRSGDPLGLLMLDLDHFKSINDTYGHLVGDRVLQGVVRTARQVLREGDVLMRYGGEEFLIVLPGAGPRRPGTDGRTRPTSRQRGSGQRGRPADRHHRQHRRRRTAPTRQAKDATELIGIADVALYTAKESGRDRSVIA